MLNVFSTKRNFLIGFIIIWLAVINFAPMSINEMANYVLFSFIGMLGAIFANTTGAGGGVVFIPMFNQLGFTELQSVATSFAIQCFGMGAGGVTWWHYYQSDKATAGLWQGYKRIIAVTSIFSIIGLWFIYGADIKAPSSLNHSFSWFSLILGIFILCTVYILKSPVLRTSISNFDWLMLMFIGFFGGAITAWLSVGVGELLAIFLIVRRFEVSMAVAAAATVSAFTVWSAIWQHTLINPQVYWQVLLFAGPGALIGGMVAKSIVMYLSAERLKLFFAFWLLVIGVAGV